MQFGKVSNTTELDRINFDLPATPQKSIEYLKTLNKKHELKIYIAAPAWGVKSWKGKIYPEKLQSKDYLKFYAQSFNSIELNTTHYRLPEKATIFEWMKDVPNEFRFCPKVTQTISHYSGLTNEQKVDEYFQRMMFFDDSFGCNFMQMHENFSPKRFNDISKFTTFLRQEYKVAVELRHNDWFKDDGIFNYFRSKNIGSVITDVAGRRDVLHMNITAPFTVIRFVGNNLHQSDYSRIDSWVKKIKEWSEFGLKEVFFFVHEPEELFCPEISDYFIQQLIKENLKINAGMNFLKKEELSLL